MHAVTNPPAVLYCYTMTADISLAIIASAKGDDVEYIRVAAKHGDHTMSPGTLMAGSEGEISD